MTFDFINNYWKTLQVYGFLLLGFGFLLTLIRNPHRGPFFLGKTFLTLICLILIVANYKDIFFIVDNKVMEIADGIYSSEKIREIVDSRKKELNELDDLNFWMSIVKEKASIFIQIITDIIIFVLLIFWEKIRMIMGSFLFLLLFFAFSLSLIQEFKSCLFAYLSKAITLFMWPIYWHCILRLGVIEHPKDSIFDFLIMRLVGIALIIFTPLVIKGFAINLTPILTPFKNTFNLLNKAIED